MYELAVTSQVLEVSVVLPLGVNVPVQVTPLSDEVIVDNAPFGQVTSSALAKPDAALENSIVRVGVSPEIMSVSDREILLTVGATVSTS